MAYFDIARTDSIDRSLPGVLGYKKIFTQKEIEIVNGLNLGNGTYIVKSAEPGILGRAMKRNNVIGIIIEDNEKIRQAVEQAVENDKLLCISVREILCTDARTRQRNIYRAKGLLAFAMRSKAKIAFLTLAEDETELVSSLQMVELAKFLGATEENAKKMASSIGEIL